MEKNIRIITAETVVRDGQLYLHYAIENNGIIKDFERPFYGNDGKVDPEVENILFLANKHNKNDEVKPVRDLTVYEEPAENAKVSRNYKGLIASGLAGVLIGVGVMAACRSCENKGQVVTPKDDETNEPVIEQEQNQIIYMTEEQYHNGVNELCNHLNETLGFNYQPVDLNSFYYSANMDKVSEELFNKLVSESYIPDTDIAIIQSTFNITSDLKTKFGQTGKMNIDFDKVFIDEQMVELSNQYSSKYNTIANASTEDIQTILDGLDEFMFEKPEYGYNTLPVGGEFIFNSIISDTIGIKAGEKGVATSAAFNEELSDVTDYVKALQHNLNCMAISETEKQLTK